MNIESLTSKVAEVKESSPNVDKSFNPDKRIDPTEVINEKSEQQKTFDPDKRITVAEKVKELLSEDKSIMDVFCEKIDLFTTLKERIDRTPKEDGPRGKWGGARGESVFYPHHEYIKTLLEKYGLKGIEYRHGIPDFSKVAETTVQIDNMTGERYGPGKNFNQADAAAAKKWSSENRNGKSDWTAADVRDWRRENKMTWHERSDMKTMDLVPSNIHDFFSHAGGVCECNKRDMKEVQFDD